MGIGGFARSTPDATALVTLGRSITFADLDSRQRRLAGMLSGGGLTPGDRIAVLSANRQEFLEVTTGALRAGIVPVPMGSHLAEPEIEYMLEDSGARWLFTDRPVATHPGLERVVTLGDAYERLLHDASESGLADHMLGRPMHYTSGTSGRPKGVWVAPETEATAAGRSSEFRREWGLTPGDVHLVCSPLSHSAPHRYAARTVEAGGTVVLLPRFEAKEVLASIEMFGITTTFMVPTHLESFLAVGEQTLRRHDVSSMRLLAHAGAPIRVPTKQQIIRLFPEGSVWEFYGATEGRFTRISAEEWLRKPGSVGTARPGARILIFDEHGHALPPGETGQVWIRDPKAETFEYWGDRARTRRAWRDGAFTVGDLGSLDDDGYLYLAGRAGDMIITGGVNVYPHEVETVLASHPAVADVAVYGVPDDEWGQVVVAAVVPAFGQPLDPELLRRWARERLAGPRCPKRIDVVNELPQR